MCARKAPTSSWTKASWVSSSASTTRTAIRHDVAPGAQPRALARCRGLRGVRGCAPRRLAACKWSPFKLNRHRQPAAVEHRMRGGYQRRARRSRHRRRRQASSTAWCRCASCRRSNAQVRQGQMLRQCGTPLLVYQAVYKPVAALQPGRTAWRRCWTCSARCCRRRIRHTRRRALRQPAWLQATPAAQQSRAWLQRPCTSAMSARCSVTGARRFDSPLLPCGALSSVRACVRSQCCPFVVHAVGAAVPEPSAGACSGLRGRGRVCRAGSRHGVFASRFDTCRPLVRVCCAAGAATL
jgi:hypothetical protein